VRNFFLVDSTCAVINVLPTATARRGENAPGDHSRRARREAAGRDGTLQFWQPIRARNAVAVDEDDPAPEAPRRAEVARPAAVWGRVHGAAGALNAFGHRARGVRPSRCRRQGLQKGRPAARRPGYPLKTLRRASGRLRTGRRSKNSMKRRLGQCGENEKFQMENNLANATVDWTVLSLDDTLNQTLHCVEGKSSMADPIRNWSTRKASETEGCGGIRRRWRRWFFDQAFLRPWRSCCWAWLYLQSSHALIHLYLPLLSEAAGHCALRVRGIPPPERSGGNGQTGADGPGRSTGVRRRQIVLKVVPSSLLSGAVAGDRDGKVKSPESAHRRKQGETNWDFAWTPARRVQARRPCIASTR